MKLDMTLKFLGTGTSCGVPQLRCGCRVCRSTDRRDARTRASALLSVGGVNILIDCSPDFYHQMLAAGQPDVDALIITHSHYDHVGGIDDLRPYCHARGGLDVYCQADVDSDLRTRIPYSFKADPYPGVPIFKLHDISAYEAFSIQGIDIMPFRVMHGLLPILGYRIGNLAYITDCKTLPAESVDVIKGVDTLVINALRPQEHATHMNLNEAFDVINDVRPRKAYLTHMSHSMGLHAERAAMLPEGVQPAYDGLSINIVD